MPDLAQFAAAAPALHAHAVGAIPAQGFLQLGTAKVAQFVAFLKILVVAGALFVIIVEYLKRRSIGAAVGAVITASLVIWAVNNITWGENHVGDELKGSAVLVVPARADGLAPSATTGQIPLGRRLADPGPVGGVVREGTAG